MRQPEEVARELVSQWLTKADEDFAVAVHLMEEQSVFLGTIAFHAQQASEKYIKALLVARQVEFPKTHDIGRLLDLIAGVDQELAASLTGAVELTDYGVEFRYPGDQPPLETDDVARALSLAGQVRRHILSRLDLR
jgi:HEPN domain-containing protein